MSKKPIQFDILAFFLVGVAAAFPIQIMVLYGHLPWEVDGIWSKLTYLNLAVMILCFVNAYFLYQSSRYALYITPALIAVTIWNNYWVGKVGTDYSMGTTFWASLVFILANGLLLTKSARTVLFNQNKRWWRTAVRRRAAIPIYVAPWLDSKPFTSQIFDISEGGAFIRMNVDGIPLIPDEITTSDFVEIRFQVAGFYQIRCSAKVVRVAKGQGQYPPGMGLKFQEMTSRDRWVLKRFLNGQMSV